MPTKTRARRRCMPSRTASTGTILRTLFIELRQVVRALAGGGVFTAVAVVCLALVIATNTTMFSVVDPMFLRPLPFPHGDQLVSISGRDVESGRRATLSLDD